MISNLAKNIQPSSTLAITAKAKALREYGIDVVGFGAGEPDFNTPKYINDAAKKALDEGFTKYTAAAGTLELRNAISHKFREENGVEYTSEQIVVSNGAKHSLMNAFMAVLNYQEEVILVAPFWLSYPEMVKMAGGIPKIVYSKKENRYKLSINFIKLSLQTCKFFYVDFT